MEKTGILVVAYGSRAAAMIDTFQRSENYAPQLYVVDKQRNPFNVQYAKEHVVIPDLNIEEIGKFAKKHQAHIDFGIVGPETPIINGVRDYVQKKTRIPLICPTKECCLEGSKVTQRHLFQKVVPEANPQFKVFDPQDYPSVGTVKKAVYAWLDTLSNKVAVKPDSAAAGKGVGVWGDHFHSPPEIFEHFLANYKEGPVIIEEKIDGEESSFQAFCDGKHVVPLPETRDYKRAFDEDRGPNTGGMGSYKARQTVLPFMTTADYTRESTIVNRIFRELRGRGSNPGLWGIPFYSAFIHSEDGPKLLENNSRPGDPEILNLLPLLKGDFVDLCYKILDGALTRIDFEEKASVVTYKVPPTYGGYSTVFPERVNRQELDTAVNLHGVSLLSEYRNRIRVYPGSMELHEGKTYPLTSRTVGVVGIGDTIDDARATSLAGVRAITGGALWHRNDIASKEHIMKSIRHMERLRTP